MNNELDFSCIDDYTRKLEQLGKKGQKIEKEALWAGGEIIMDEMWKRAPVRTGKSRGLLTITTPKKDKNGNRYVKIGIQKSDNSEAFYLKFYEWGTSKQIARPFMRPAFERKRSEALEITKKIIREELRK